MSDDKATMTLNLSRREMDVVEQLAAETDLTKTQVLRQALRMYQLVRHRIMSGETMMFSGDEGRSKVLIVGPGFDPITKLPEQSQ